MRIEEFILKAKEVHGDKYDYSKVEYKNNRTKVCIICPKHGEFWQIPKNHINKGTGCPKCGVDIVKNKRKIKYSDFLQRARRCYAELYDYSLISEEDIDGNETKIRIICPKHGEFIKTVHNHLSGQGCPKCSRELVNNKLRKTKEEWVEKCRLVHGDKYKYIIGDDVNAKNKITIICPKHGEFKQNIINHIGGQGCPICKESHLEREIRYFLEGNDIKFEYQKRFDWLGKQSLDFYLPDYRIAIECQGSQHFENDKFYKA